MSEIQNRFREFGQYPRDEMIRDLKMLVDQVNTKFKILTEQFGDYATTVQLEALSQDVDAQFTSLSADVDTKFDTLANTFPFYYSKAELDPILALTLMDRGEFPAGGVDLNAYATTAHIGVWRENHNADAAAGQNFPAPVAGTLEVFSGGAGPMQRYTTYGTDGARVFIRARYQTTWSDWEEAVKSSGWVTTPTGRYKRESDGLQICKVDDFQLTADATTFLSGLWTFPASFVDLNYHVSFSITAQQTTTGTDQRRTGLPLVNRNAGSNATIGYMSPGNYIIGQQARVSALAIGFWK